MKPEEMALLELAMKHRLLTRKQAEMVREELTMFPGETAGHLMLRRHYVTDDQLAALQGELGVDGSADAADDSELDLAEMTPTAAIPQRPTPPSAPIRPPAPPTAPGIPPGADPPSPAGGPPRQLSIADLRRGEVPPPNIRNQAAVAGIEGRPSPAAAAPPQQPAPQQGAPAKVPPQVTPQARPPQVAGPAPAAAAGASNMPTNLAGFLRLARHWGASDLHLCVGRPPFVRIFGTIRYMEMEALTAARSRELNFSGLTPEQAAEADENQQLDFALEIPGVGRHRCNVFRHRLGWDGAYRIVSATVPTLEKLGLPPTVKMFTEYHQGLVMITGAGGSGKTSTAAALLDIVNANRPDHIITVEDPIEYVLAPKRCQITQREVGRHTQSFSNALRAALREDPDIILVGEMRDRDTTAISISAAETGHLVFSTMNTSSAARTVARIVDFYPVTQQTQVMTMVAESLRGVITQQLIGRKDNRGAALAYEILVNSSGVAQQIKEGKTHMITSLIQSGKKYGMILMDESLMNLVNAGAISGKEAYKRANNKQPFEAVKNND